MTLVFDDQETGNIDTTVRRHYKKAIAFYLLRAPCYRIGHIAIGPFDTILKSFFILPINLSLSLRLCILSALGRITVLG